MAQLDDAIVAQNAAIDTLATELTAAITALQTEIGQIAGNNVTQAQIDALSAGTARIASAAAGLAQLKTDITNIVP